MPNADPLVEIRRAEQAQAARSNTEAVWEEIRELLYPSGDSLIEKEPAGTKSHRKVLDNTGEQASELLAAALFSGLTHPDLPWFTVGVVDYDRGADPEADLWLELTSRAMLRRFMAPSSAFAPNQDEKLLDLVTYGTGVTYIGERPGQTPLFQARSMAECFIEEGADGGSDSLCRVFEYSARQAVSEWGAAAGEKVAQKAASPHTENEKFTFIHNCYPRLKRDRESVKPSEMPFASVIVNKAEKHVIRDSGFPEFPYAIARWRKRANESYGRGPGHKALADVKMLQRAMRSQIRGVEKIVDPSLMVADDGVLNTPRLGSGKLTYVRADLLQHEGSPIRPIQTGGRPDLGEQFLDGVRQRIQFAFYTHLIEFARDPKMTATQFLGITEQTRNVLAPILARLAVQDLQPQIARVYAIGLRSGWFPPPPRSLAGRELQVSYNSPLSKQQNIGEVRAASQAFDVLLPVIAQTGRTDVLDNYDLDAIARDTGSTLGMRASWIHGIEKVQQIREARLQERKQAADMEQAVMAAEGAAKGAKALQLLQGGRAA